MNLVLLDGVLSRDATVKDLPSGSRLVLLEVTTRDQRGEACSVPVEWFDPRRIPEWAAGTGVAVLGSVRRRFFRSGGRTESRTAVVAERVVCSDDRRSVGRLVAAAARGVGT